MRPLPDKYDPKEAEPRLQKAWEAKKIYHWDESASRADTYVIDTPPPTISGALHMGHIFSYTQADFVARYQRMMGKTVFYPMGFDDNGLPTERLVEKTKGKKAAQYDSREAFIAVCTEVSEQARKEFRQLFESVALSVDWRQEYHTISEDSRRLSQLSFLDLQKKNLAYRQLQPMLWDPVDQTAIAQAEVVDKEVPSQFVDIAFQVAETGADLIIATTRPELLPACVAVFVHPEDERYANLIGKHALTPLFGVKIPILADDKVQPEKGSGAVMCCTFGDETDIHWWKTHKLATRVILNKYGKISFDRLDVTVAEELASQLTALKAETARIKIIELLEAANLVRDKKPITHTVKTAERSGAILELLPTHQWFVRVLKDKTALTEKSRACAWHPEWMAHRMEQWIDGLNWDWCISRQRYYGVPFPVWYVRPYGSSDADWVTIFAQPKDLPVNPLSHLPKGMIKNNGLSFEATGSVAAYASEDIFGLDGEVLFPANPDLQLEVRPDTDVMDTWATSSISPQLNAHGITPGSTTEPDRFAKLFPADLRPQAHEIIRTWAFYTLVKAHHHEDSVPWKNLMISGWCLAEDKTKMSKSKGNVVTPTALLAEHGADVVRYWASTSRLGADTAFSTELLKIGRKLVNKLWNATKFAAIQLESLTEAPGATPLADKARFTEALDRWIISRLGHAIDKASKAFEEYEYANARAALEDFFWNDFCDQYLELVKARAYDADGKNPTGKLSAQLAIHHCLDGILRGFAPVLPHITDELWAHIFPEKHAKFGSIHARGTWPKAADYPRDETAEKSGTSAVALLTAIRKAKSERAVSIKAPIARAECFSGQFTWPDLAPVADDVKGAGNVAELAWAEGLPATEDGLPSLALTFAEAEAA